MEDNDDIRGVSMGMGGVDVQDVAEGGMCVVGVSVVGFEVGTNNMDMGVGDMGKDCVGKDNMGTGGIGLGLGLMGMHGVCVRGGTGRWGGKGPSGVRLGGRLCACGCVLCGSLCLWTSCVCGVADSTLFYL